MTAPVTSDQLARLEHDLAGLVHEADRIRGAVHALRDHQVRRAPMSPQPTAPHTGPVPVVAPPVPPRTRWVPAPPPPAPPRTPRLALPSLSPARVLAVTGAVSTLLGVVLFLVLAVGRGWFAPEVRLAGGLALGLGLVGAATWTRRRQGAGAAVPALAVTGVVSLFLTVAAATSLYAALPPVPAVVAALVITAGGLVLADRWDDRGLAIGVLVAGGIAAPLVVGTFSPLLVALLLAAQLGALPVAVRRGWSAVAAVASSVAGIGALGAAVRMLAGHQDLATTALAVVGALAVGLLVMWFVRAEPASSLAAGLPVLPVLLAAAGLERVPGTAVAAGVALALLVVLALLDRAGRAASAAGVVVAGAATLSLVVATALVMRTGPLAAPLLGEAALLGLVAALTHRRGPLLAAAAVGAVGWVVAIIADVPPALLARFVRPPSVGDLLAAVVVSVLLAAAAVVGLVALARLGLLRDRTHAALAATTLGVLGLYGAAGSVVAAAMLVSPTREGFLAGHVLVTVSWAAVALVLLVRGLHESLPRVLGGVLVVAAVVKLVVFDLTALDGLARVAAFLGAGLVLLAAGSRYAKAVGA